MTDSRANKSKIVQTTETDLMSDRIGRNSLPAAQRTAFTFLF